MVDFVKKHKEAKKKYGKIIKDSFGETANGIRAGGGGGIANLMKCQHTFCAQLKYFIQCTRTQYNEHGRSTKTISNLTTDTKKRGKN